MDGEGFRKFLVVHSDSTDAVIEAPNEGSAVEFYLACHGMFGYDEPPLVIDITGTDIVPDESAAAFLKIMGDADFAMLQKHHQWRTS